MKNYTVLKTNVPDIFTLEDECGKPVADVRGEAEANAFASLPEKTILLEIMVATLNDIVDNKGKFNDGIELFLTTNGLRK